MKDNLDVTTDSIIDAEQYVAVTLKDKCIEVHASVTSPANALGLYAASLRSFIQSEIPHAHPALVMHELTNLVLNPPKGN